VLAVSDSVATHNDILPWHFLRYKTFMDANNEMRAKYLKAMMALGLDDFAARDVTDDDYVYGHKTYCQVCVIETVRPAIVYRHCHSPDHGGKRQYHYAACGTCHIEYFSYRIGA
jgi:hypothetical protein